MLWVDKFRPTTLNGLSYHDGLTERLKALCETGDIPHLLFYGPSGAGKKTRVMCLLREMFGPGVQKVRLEHRTFKTASGKPIELTTLGSNYHIEMNPSDAGNNDRLVVQEVIKEIAQYHPVLTQNSNKGNTLFGSSSSSSTSQATEKGSGKANFKVVFLSDCDSLTKAAQHGLRRTMEKYVRSCRLILCCENLSKVIEPLRSRCLAIRVPAPTHDEICSVLKNVSTRAFGQIPDQNISSIATASGRNLRRAILMAEACKVDGSETNRVPLPDWELYIKKIANQMMKNQSPNSLLECRKMVYDLLGNCIPATVIFQHLVKNLLKTDEMLQHDILCIAADYEHRMQHGSKDIFHLEAFIAKFMMLYKKYIMDMFD
uniref:Replication factor C subunit 3 n=1 Tax=Mucochytrium quahogii TaxID=96639 RepID=A0A7S2RDF6_9STRA|mmetsp:Transcript_18710/g.30538  ORF Transcript_18710/g.30538 Transcript_18710/m.30538 type:complete len:373 (-) Transcript_18710:45-1163(-)|eukprot:CAMPEP_0203785268 /NCGR_PEP_ID=MMETSP0100_2-20121128/931_1 /ASSEMBLY_ACC=CAM_ASM_000210 /TAXON_ID=96639 /ORGANISM=" , Strain NY0313808BC1" /LENGTH=372 /DNA_ID=CAMNT_0050687349 /DNA_START=153 /DNA_END=1271 /DNA_ORIENTATION=-